MRARRVLLAASGAAIATVSATCGIGGGVFGVPLLHYLFGMELRRAVATTLALVFAASTTATFTEALHPESALFWGLAAALSAAALLGTQLGYRIARRIRTAKLKAIFCVVLAVVGARVMLREPGAPGSLGYAPDVAGYAVAAAIGFCAGIVVPLLGVGGGLVVVPCLLFLLPEVGYLGARATSLAMATVTSARSLRLYARDGDVEWGDATWFAGGALGGAAVGVWLVHLDGVAAVGQVVLGIVLCLSAVRFGLDVARTSRNT